MWTDHRCWAVIARKRISWSAENGKNINEFVTSNVFNLSDKFHSIFRSLSRRKAKTTKRRERKRFQSRSFDRVNKSLMAWWTQSWTWRRRTVHGLSVASQLCTRSHKSGLSCLSNTPSHSNHTWTSSAAQMNRSSLSAYSLRSWNM